ncbi:tRNA (guanosine(37)-N1)-methyltransferase TrmD, partial [Streptococcus danieliae]|nr:tRNA (guanosine(37)-N1)-methyltransferase TrmD [Streptococcus danieliae]
VPQVIGKESSHTDDSFSSGLLEHPQYTRPYDFRGMTVPDVLMSGHHEHIRQWRLFQSLKKTLIRRPDLLESYSLSKEEEKFLQMIQENREIEELF